MKREGKEKISGKSGEKIRENSKKVSVMMAVIMLLLISLAPFSAVVAVKDPTPTPAFLFEFIEPPTPAEGADVPMGEIIITVNVSVTADTLEDEVNTVWLNWTDGYNFTEAMMPMVDDLTWSLNVTEMMGEEITEGTYYYTVYANDIWNNTGVSPTRTVNVIAAPIYGVSLTVDGKKTAAKTTMPNVNATYTLTVKNTGNQPDNYMLYVDNADNAAVANLNMYSITNLAPSATQTVLLNVTTVLLNVTDESEGIYRVNVTVVSQGNTSVFDYVNTTTFTVVGLPKTGDMDNDGTITFDDVILLAKHYYFGDTVYADPDVDSSGAVDFDDVILLAKHYYFGDPIYP